MIEESRLPILAAARSIHASASMLFPKKDVQSFLVPQLLSKNRISIGGTLIFSDHQFSNIVQNGFGIPKIKNVMISPLRSSLSIFILWKFGKFYKSEKKTSQGFAYLFGSLEAICTYLNNHSKIGKIFDSEKNCRLLVNIAGAKSNFLISYESKNGWSVNFIEEKISATASLTFKNHETAREASLGSLDPWLALATGDILLAGRIPMLDKFGYISRMVRNEIPYPK